jgi:hypothetical protein
MDNIAGPPVEGDNFFGRDLDVAAFVDTLRNHDILLLGPRRIGKTSFARAVMTSLVHVGWNVLEINVATCVDERGFIEKLNKAIDANARSGVSQVWSSLQGSLNKLTRRIQSVKVPVPGAGSLGIDLKSAEDEDWSNLASDTLRVMGEIDQPWLIYIDELPIFLYNIIRNDSAQGVQRVRRFLDWFRNDVRGLPECHQMRWLITGSVGLDTLVQRHGMADTINSLKHESLTPFSETLAADMVQKLAQRYELAFSADDAKALVQAVQWPQPYYLQLVFNVLRQLGAQHGKAPASLINDAMTQAVQPGTDNDFHHWEERLEMQLGPSDAGHAIALLTASSSIQGARPESLLVTLQGRTPNDTEEAQTKKFIELRDVLLRDAYWAERQDNGVRHYGFRLELLRLWWVRRHLL